MDKYYTVRLNNHIYKGKSLGGSSYFSSLILSGIIYDEKYKMELKANHIDFNSIPKPKYVRANGIIKEKPSAILFEKVNISSTFDRPSSMPNNEAFNNLLTEGLIKALKNIGIVIFDNMREAKSGLAYVKRYSKLIKTVDTTGRVKIRPSITPIPSEES